MDQDSNVPPDLRESLRQRERGNDALGRDDAESARVHLERAFELNPRDDDSALIASMLHARQGRLARAAELAAAAVKARPFHPAAFNFLGVLSLESGRYRLAEDLLRHAIRMAPGFGTARGNLKDVKRRRRKRAAADRQRAGEPEAIWGSLRALTAGGPPRVSVLVVVDAACESGLQATLESIAPAPLETIILGIGLRGASAGGPIPGATRWHAVPDSGDRGAALNEGLQLCRGDWILLLNAGETLDDPEGSLESVLGDRRLIAGVVPVHRADAAPRFEARLTRNAPGLYHEGRWRPDLRGRLHESIRAWGLSYAPLPAGIRGARREPLLNADQRDLERRWLEERITHKPDSWAAHLALGRLALERDDLAAAKEHSERARDLVHGSPTGRLPLFVEPVDVLHGLVLGRRNGFSELAAAMSRHHDLCGPSAASRFLEGLAWKALDDPAKAVTCLLRARELAAEPAYAAPPEAVGGPGLLHLLSAAQLDAQLPDEAERTLRDADALHPGDLHTQLGLAGVHIACGNHEAFLQAMDRIAREHGALPEAWQIAGGILLRHPRLGPTAVEWFAEATRRHPNDEALQRLLGRALIQIGRAPEGLRLLQSFEDRDGHDAAVRMAAALASRTALPEIPHDLRPGAIEGLIEQYRQWAVAGVFESLDRVLNDLPRAEHALPGIVEATAAWLDGEGQDDAACRLRRNLNTVGAGS